jgi:hypothetical protein
MTDQSKDLLFLIPLCVRNSALRTMWIHCYESIRKFYPESKIVFINNNSDPEYLQNDILFTNCDIINSEVPESRLFSPFYYYLKYYSDYSKAIILHDGNFFREHIDFSGVKGAKFFWHFDSRVWNNKSVAKQLYRKLNNSREAEHFFISMNWSGCLGCMMVIDYSLLHKIQEKYNILVLKDYIYNCVTANMWERIIACLCIQECNTIMNDISFFGNYKQLNEGFTYIDYCSDPHSDYVKKMPLVKVFSSRL